MFDALIKVGGSVCHSPQLKDYASQWAELTHRYRLLFLAGGGLFADQVRAVDTYFELSDSAAHWMAISAIDQSGYLLADRLPGVRTVYDIDSANNLAADGVSSVLIPSAMLRQHDPLPHSWDVTSDALAAWLAGFAGVSRLILLKDVPGVYEADAPISPPPLLAETTGKQLARFDIVDPFFVKSLPDRIECWIIDGREPQRLAELLETGATTGTRVAED